MSAKPSDPHIYKFIRRRSYMLKDHKDKENILMKGQHAITIYQNGHVVGRYQTSIRKVYRNGCHQELLYLAGTNLPNRDGEGDYGEFQVGIWTAHGNFFHMICDGYGGTGILGYNLITGELRSSHCYKDYKDVFRVDHYENSTFEIEITGGDYFHDIDIIGVLTMLNYRILPNDLVRTLKPYLY